VLLLWILYVGTVLAQFQQVSVYPAIGALTPVAVPIPPIVSSSATMAAYCTVLNINDGLHTRQVFCRTQIDGTAGAPTQPSDIQTSSFIQPNTLSTTLAQPFAVFLCNLDATRPTYLGQKLVCDQSTECMFSAGMLPTSIYTSAPTSGGQTLGELQDPSNLSPDRDFYCCRTRQFETAASVVWENDTCIVYPSVVQQTGSSTPGIVACPGQSVHAACFTSVVLNNVPTGSPDAPAVAAATPADISTIINQAVASAVSLMAALASPLIAFFESIQGLGVVHPYLCNFDCEFPCYTPSQQSVQNLCSGSDQNTLCAPSTFSARCLVDIFAHPDSLCVNTGEVLVALKNTSDPNAYLDPQDSLDPMMRAPCENSDLGCELLCLCLAGCPNHPRCSRAGTFFQSQQSIVNEWCACNSGHISSTCMFSQSMVSCTHGQNMVDVGSSYNSISFSRR